MPFRRATAPVLAWIALVLAPSTAIAERGSRSTLMIVDGGVRLPWGSTSHGDRAVRELVELEFTAEVVLAFPVSEHFLVGPVGGSAWLWPGRAMRAVCDAARAQGHETCSTDGLALRLGVRGEWHPLRGRSFGPWLGMQSGYEFLLIGGRERGVGFEEHLNGFELFSARVHRHRVLRLGAASTNSPRVGVSPEASPWSLTSDTACRTRGCRRRTTPRFRPRTRFHSPACPACPRGKSACSSSPLHRRRRSCDRGR
jgi:hypothetical protein